MKRLVFFLAVILSFSFVLNADDACHGWGQGRYAFTSALFWRNDDSGDYVLPKIDASSTVVYEIPDSIETRGAIRCLSVYWEFEGEVTLEVSADNGNTYLDAVCGASVTVPGDAAGSNLKWKAIITPGSELKEVKVSYCDDSGILASFGEPQLSGFMFRKRIDITNPAGEGLFNYQVKIVVDDNKINSVQPGIRESDVDCEGKIKNGFRDVRFTCGDGETILPHYLEKVDKVKANLRAVFWVKIPQVPASGLPIYIYYGNSGAQDLSSGTKVFDFFDDFQGGTLDTDKWEVYTYLGGSYTLRNSNLEISSAKIISKKYRVKDGVIECQADLPGVSKHDKGYENRIIIRADKKSLASGERAQTGVSSSYEGAEHCLAVGSIVKVNDPEPAAVGKTYGYSALVKGEDIIFRRHLYGNGVPVDSYETGAGKEAEVKFRDSGGITEGYIGLDTGAENRSVYRWVRARKIAEKEPVPEGLANPQEPAGTAEFMNTTLDGNGNVILKDKSFKGIYVSATVSSDFLTRVIVPSWQEDRNHKEEVRVDVSADGGRTFKTNCQNDTAYYASKQDFTAGTKVKYRLYFFPGTEGSAVTEINIDYRPGKILVVTPNGGERWQSGKYQKILWLASEYDFSYPMRIEYSLNGGRTYSLIEKNQQNIGVYFWKVPPKQSKEVIIKVSDSLCEDVYDVSDRVLEVFN